MLPIKQAIVILLSAAIFILSGCASKNPHYIGPNKIQIIDEKAYLDGKFLKVVANVKNNDTSTQQDFVYQIQWKDNKGTVVDTSPWKSITLTGVQQIQIVEMTNLSDVVDYAITISTPNN